MLNPTVSVLIPSYNYAHFLDETIQSVLTQTYQDFELVICDNASTDNTDEVVKKYLADTRVRYYKNATNLGVVGNLNMCLEYAQGKYIKYLCADDKFEPTLLEKFVAAMQKYPDVSLVTSYRQAFDRSDEVVKLPLTGWHTGQEIINHTLTTYGWLGEPTAVMFKRENLRLGNFRKDITWLLDAEMWLRQLTAGNCYIVPEVLSKVRIHSSQITKKVMRNFVNYFEEYYLAKDIQQRKGYNIDTSQIDIDAIVKKRATKCAKAMYKVMPRLLSKSQRSIFVHAYTIARKEHVLLAPIAEIIGKKLTGKTKSTNAAPQYMTAQ